MTTSLVSPSASVTPAAARAYAARVDEMVAYVDRELAGRPDLLELLGPNPFSVAHTNHENHGRFMVTVLAYGAGDLLARTLPWVYASYHAHGFSYDYFPVELAVWEGAVAACLAPREAAEILPLYRWMGERHGTTVEQAAARAQGTAGEERGLGGPAQMLLAALLRGDLREARRLAEEAVPEATRLAGFYLDVLQPSLSRVGTLWERGEITVAQEHLASAVVGSVMASLYGRILSRGPNRPVAVVTTASGEFHELGARMVSDLLEVDGWDVRYLGANTPPEDLGALCAAEHALLVAVSATMHFHLDTTARMIEAVRRRSPCTGVLVGGQAFVGGDEEFWRLVGADAWAPDAAAAVERARRWSKMVG